MFVPAAGRVNLKTTKRYRNTFVNMMCSSEMMTSMRMIGMVGLPIIFIGFNIIFFIIGMTR